jgi:hypothetical protein
VVDPERKRSAAAERVTQEKVEGAEPRQIETLDAPTHQVGEAALDRTRGKRVVQERVRGGRARDDADVRAILVRPFRKARPLRRTRSVKASAVASPRRPQPLSVIWLAR